MEKSSLDAAMFVKNNKNQRKSGTLAPSVLYYTQPKPTFHIPIAASFGIAFAFTNRKSYCECQPVKVKILRRIQSCIRTKPSLAVTAGKEFVFTASEQAFYAEKGFQNKAAPLPGVPCSVPCPERRRLPAAQMFTAICADCGKETQVPFQPRGDSFAYCRDCFREPSSPRYIMSGWPLLNEVTAAEESILLQCELREDFTI